MGYSKSFPKLSAGNAGLSQPRQNGLIALLEASQTAKELGGQPSTFACQLSLLKDQGVTETTLRWLVTKALAIHYLENTRPKGHSRTFRTSSNLCFTPKSCFLLTPAGSVLAESLSPVSLKRRDAAARRRKNNVPYYNESARQLLFKGRIVKQYERAAENQKLVLLSFVEQDWVPCISDPLPSRADSDPKKRLNDTIRNLNTRQINKLIRFHGDGTGTAIVWKKVR